MLVFCSMRPDAYGRPPYGQKAFDLRIRSSTEENAILHSPPPPPPPPPTPPTTPPPPPPPSYSIAFFFPPLPFEPFSRIFQLTALLLARAPADYRPGEVARARPNRPNLSHVTCAVNPAPCSFGCLRPLLLCRKPSATPTPSGFCDFV